MEAVTTRTYRSLSEYIQERGGAFIRPRFPKTVLTLDEVLHNWTHWKLKGPVTVVSLATGEDAIYSFHSWEAARRDLVLIRLEEERGREALETLRDRNVYYDYAPQTMIAPSIMVPKTRGRKGWIFECATCGEKAAFPGSRYPAERAARDGGWHCTLDRGWVCPQHYYYRSRRRTGRASPYYRENTNGNDHTERDERTG